MYYDITAITKGMRGLGWGWGTSEKDGLILLLSFYGKKPLRGWDLLGAC